jgi:hypothetical protein
MKAKIFSRIIRLRENISIQIGLNTQCGAPISSLVEAYAETGANRSRSPDYDRGPDATFDIKEDYHVSCH